MSDALETELPPDVDVEQTSDPDSPEAALRALVRPHSVEEFLSRYWENQHLHVSRDDAGLAAGLMTIEDIDEILTAVYANGARRWDAVRMARDGFLVSPDEFLRNKEGPLAQIDVEHVVQMYRQGASIILNRVHEVLPRVFQLCSDLSNFFGVPVHANAYANPPGAQALPLHFDAHDVFMLQIAGEKTWNLYPSPVVLATPATQGDNCPAPAGLGWQYRLRAGELIYLPRGLLHEGVTDDQMSLHLSIGVNQYTWARLFADMLAGLEHEDSEFRRSVAPRLANPDEAPEQFATTLARLASRMAEVDLTRQAASRHAIDTRRRNARPRPGSFTAAAAVFPIVMSTTPVQIRPGCAVVIEQTERDVLLRFDQRTLSLPSYTEPHLRRLCGGSPISAMDLPADLDEAGRLVLVRRLVREGLLRVDGSR